MKERVPSLAALLGFAKVQHGLGVNEEPGPSSKCLQQLQPSSVVGTLWVFWAKELLAPSLMAHVKLLSFSSSGTKWSFSDQEVSFQTFLCTTDWVVYQLED